MKLAILVTNTDHSHFASAWPDDAEKFTSLVHSVRPDWICSAYDLPRGEFPKAIHHYDGVIIGGSPAFLSEGHPWIAALLDLIRQMERDRQPVFGTCFGHQAIAKALGGSIEPNRQGWGHGLLDVTMKSSPAWFKNTAPVNRLYGSHAEQVTEPPIGATIWCSSPSCDIAGFFMGTHVFTIQHHPEIQPDFMAALIDELADYVGNGVTQKARHSMAEKTPDNKEMAEAMARFFEQGAGARQVNSFA